MGSYLTVWSALACDACGEQHETAIETELPDVDGSASIECRTGERVSEAIAGSTHEGVSLRYCPPCDEAAYIAEMTAHLDQLAAAVERGEIQVYSEFWVFEPEADPVVPATRRRLREEPIPTTEIRQTPTRATSTTLGDVWDLLEAIPMAVYRTETPLFPTDADEFDPWWGLHFEAVEDSLADQGWLPGGRYRDVALAVDAEQRVRLAEPRSRRD